MNEQLENYDPDSDTIKVLLIEDDYEDFLILREMLAEVWSTRFSVVNADRLQAGIECLTEGDVDVILLDLNLPDSTGLDTLRELRSQEGGKTPILVMTGLDDEMVGVKALQEGAQDYLVKGEVGSNLLARCIRYAIERHRVEDQIRASLAEKVVLLKEVHHRVKNNLQIISSLLNLQSEYIKDEQSAQMFMESQSRIKSMALIHEKLYESDDLAKIDFAEYIQDLADHLFYIYGNRSRNIKLQVQVEDVSLDIDTAVPCGLIINELVSNSLKYGFPADRNNGDSGESGHEVRIEFRLDSNGETVLLVSDNGIGFPEDLDFRNTESLGLQLVNTLAGQLGGDIELSQNDGTAFRITFAGGG